MIQTGGQVLTGNRVYGLTLSILQGIVAVHKLKIMQGMNYQGSFPLDKIIHKAKLANSGEDIGNKRVWHQRSTFRGSSTNWRPFSDRIT